MKPAKLHDDAEVELQEALEYYGGLRLGLDGAFRREFEAALQSVQENPLLYAIEDDQGIRCCPLRRFPYSLVYVDLPAHVWVAAVAHQSRLPGYWGRRQPDT